MTDPCLRVLGVELAEVDRTLDTRLISQWTGEVLFVDHLGDEHVIGRPPRIDSLQVFRAFAAIFVLLFHLTGVAREQFDYELLGGMFSFGYTGVDFFFVLSGFIIYYIHHKDIGRPERGVRYLAKRCLRIYPIYWFMTVLKLGIIFAVPSVAKPYETDPAVIAKSFALWPQSGNLPVIGAAWTLTYEMLFYILFGVAIVVGARHSKRLFLTWTLAIAGLHLAKITGLYSSGASYAAEFLLNERNLEFVLGVGAAHLVLNRTIPHVASKLLATLGAALFMISAWHVDRGGSIPYFTLLFGIPSFLLVAGSASWELYDSLEMPRPLVFLGDASYSIYLSHAMFLTAGRMVVDRLDLVSVLGPSLVVVLMAIGALVGGSMMFLLIERPLMHLTRRWLNVTLGAGERARA